MAGSRRPRASTSPGSWGETHRCLCRAKSLRELFPRGCAVAAAIALEYRERFCPYSIDGPATAILFPRWSQAANARRTLYRLLYKLFLCCARRYATRDHLRPQPPPIPAPNPSAALDLRLLL